MLKGKIALVTGGTKGIGKSIAESLSKQGATVIITARNKEKSSHEFYTCDVSDNLQVATVISAIIKKHKRIDILVNNAGIYPFVPFSKMKTDQWKQVIDINLNGIFYITHSVIPYMHKGGRIVNIASIAGTSVGFPGLVHYCTTKAGVAGFTKALALELAPHITVNAIAPGPILTPGVESMGKEEISLLTKACPVGRIGKPEDIAHTVLFLVDEKASFITGQTITVDGGYTLQ